jgi:hypothetical protein
MEQGSIEFKILEHMYLEMFHVLSMISCRLVAEHMETELCFMLSCWSFYFIYCVIYLFNHKWSQALKENFKLPEPL